MNLRTRRHSPIWPYIGVVACLAVLTILAPRSWEKLSLPRYSMDRSPDSGVTVDLSMWRGDDAVQGGAHQPVTGRLPLAPQVEPLRRSPPVAAAPERSSVRPGPAAQDDLRLQLVEIPSLEAFQAPSQPAKVAPPVAEQIELDLSIAETPSLPEPEPASEAWRPRAQRTVAPFVSDRIPGLDESVIDVRRGWPYPAALLAQLAKLHEHEMCRAWTLELQLAIERLAATGSITDAGAADPLSELSKLAARGRALAAGAPPQLRPAILRTVFAVARRATIWKQVHGLAVSHADTFPVSVAPAQIRPVISAVEQRFAESGHLDSWRRYLMLDQLRTLDEAGSAASRRMVARQVLSRMGTAQLNRRQEQLFADPPFTQFTGALRSWASAPVDYVRLLEDLEAYEESVSAGEAELVAEHYETCRWSAHAQVSQLAETLNMHYRNANFRMAITDDLINRLLPRPVPASEPVVEDILGACVSGTSCVSTRLQVSLMPDPHQWRLGVEAVGVVQSDTAASKGPAVFYNEGVAQFHARKLLLVDRQGVRVRLAEAGAQSSSSLRAFETDYDYVPFFGWLARNFAYQQHEESYYQAQAEAASRLEYRASDRLDEEVHSRLDELERDFQEQVLRPLTQLSLNPVALDMQTTDERLIVRYRVASDEQLGAHTPRPQAPADSLLSVQLHETAVNNIAQQLQLAGRRWDLPSLFRELANTFGRSDWELPDDLPEDVTLQFADQDPLRIVFDEGQVVVTVRFAELSNGRRHWHDFAVRTFYQPDPSQLEANLVREDAIHLPEGRLRLGDQIALRGIFSKVFSKSRPIKLINRKLADNPELADLQVTQFIIKDGWLGTALGPQRDEGVQHLAQEPEAERR